MTSLFRGIGNVVKWVTIVGVLIVVIVIILAVVGLGKGASHDASQGKAVSQKIHLVKLGMSVKQVKAILGKPESTQEDHSAGETDRYLYYGTLSNNSWQFVFTNGKLTAKNRN